MVTHTHGHPALDPLSAFLSLRLRRRGGVLCSLPNAQVAYTGRGQVVYPCGALGVVLSVDGPAPTQAYMNAHTDLILCLRAHTLANQQTLVCSGEAGKRPKVLVWSTGGRTSASGPEVLACLKGFHQDGVAQVAWALDGELVLTV